jgi:hypothetical protein
MLKSHTVRMPVEDDMRLTRLRLRCEREHGYRPSMQQTLMMAIKAGLDRLEGDDDRR